MVLRMIICDDLPFTHVESVYFRNALKYVSGHVNIWKPVGADTLKKDVMKAFELGEKNMKSTLQVCRELISW